MIKNNSGVVYDENGNICNNIFTAGWVKTGPKGVIDSTLRDSHETAESIFKSIEQGNVKEKNCNYDEILNELKSKRVKYITNNAWKKIDEYEVEQGRKKDKIREKVTDLDTMLKLI